MRDCHRGAQEGQALFYWFQAVFFLLTRKQIKSKNREADRQVHMQIESIKVTVTLYFYVM